MRKQFAASVTQYLAQDQGTVLLLGDIGVHAFRDAFKAFPGRVFNVGILEQAMVSVAAGWALRGFLPIVHTIAPFLVERAYEQLKIDFGYQQLGGVFVSVGGSYDYASLGCTHHCPADVALIGNIPGFRIYVPGSAEEVKRLFNSSDVTLRSRASYIRLSEHSNSAPQPLGLTAVYKASFHGLRPVVIAVGPTLDMVMSALTDCHADIWYTNAVHESVTHALAHHYGPHQPFIVVENSYSSLLAPSITQQFFPSPVAVTSFSIPRHFVQGYGTKREVDNRVNFTPHRLRNLVISCQRP